jgi:hypothetical protein
MLVRFNDITYFRTGGFFEVFWAMTLCKLVDGMLPPRATCLFL